MKKLLTIYFGSWWLSGLVYLCFLAGLTIATISNWKPLAIAANILLCGAGAALVGIIAAAIWNLIRKRWAKGIGNLIFLMVCGAITVFAFSHFMVPFMLGSSGDGFADNLKIPANIDVAEPLKELDAKPGNAVDDAFQAALVSALKVPDGRDSTISGNVTSLMRLQRENSEVLRRYLASSPAWRVFEEHGEIFATRRWMIGSEWRYDLYGYYIREDIDPWSEFAIPNFQSRFTIGLSGKPWAKVNSDTTWLRAGETRKAKISTGNQMHESHCVISAGRIVVDVFEQSGTPERRLTKAALAFLETELQPLAENPTWAIARQMLSPNSIRNGDPSIEIRKSFEPGIYDSRIWLNPGEPGMIYLKAFEVTKGTSLSVKQLKDNSNELIGWSTNPKELFFSNTHFTIYEGDWGKPYAARLEVWFKPLSGGPDRQLIEKVFKIEGWQR